MRVPSIRQFTEQDWNLLGGAEKFTDGCEPFVADDFEYSEVIAIADRNGLQILVDGDEYRLSIIKENLNSWESGLAEEFFRIFIGSIAGLTDDETILYCRGIGFRLVYTPENAKICPRCNKKYTAPPAISRRDNTTEICPQCGTTEALEDYFNSLEEVVFKDPDFQGGTR